MTQPLDYVPTQSALFHPKPRAFNPLALAIALLVGIAIAIAASWFYIWFYFDHNELFTRLAACAGMSIGLVVLSTLVCEIGEVGNARSAFIVALLLSTCALYFSWVFWMHRNLTLSLGQAFSVWLLIRKPVPLVQTIWRLHYLGTWSHNNMQYRGWPLLVIWVVEALLFIVPSSFFATRMITRRTPRCVNCRRHVQRAGEVLKFSSRDEAAFVNTVLERQFERLAEFVQSDDEREQSDSPRILLKLYECPRCTDGHLLHAASVNYVTTKKGNVIRVERALIEYMIIGAEQAEYITSMSENHGAKRALPENDQNGTA